MKLLRRKIDNYLKEWKSDKERMPLIVKGARQVGKTASILQFAHDNYQNVVAINFVLQQKYKASTIQLITNLYVALVKMSMLYGVMDKKLMIKILNTLLRMNLQI